MSDFDTGIGKTVGIYAIVLGLLYIAVGAAKIVLPVSGIGSVGPIPGNDALGGLFFFVIAATYLMGVKGTSNGEYRVCHSFSAVSSYHWFTVLYIF